MESKGDFVDGTVRGAHQVPAVDWLLWLRDNTGWSPDGCWLWQGSRTSSGYGTVRITTDECRVWMVHRAAWSAYTGVSIPAGQEVDHLCVRTLCCNPRHLEVVSREENIRRAVERRAARRPPPPAPTPSGSIRQRPTKRGVSFAVRYRDYSSGTEVETSRTFGSRQDAESFLASLPGRKPYAYKGAC